MSKLIVGVNDLAMVNPELAKEWDYEKNAPLTPKDVTCGSGKKVWWVCKEGHEWQAQIVNRANGQGCPYCSGCKVLVGVNDLATMNPELAKEWNYEKNAPLTPKDVMVGSGKKVWWKCENGHEWNTVIDKRTKRGDACPYCSGKYAIKGETDLVTTHPELVKEWNYEKNERLPQDYKANSGKKVWWKCEKGHEWSCRIQHRSKGIGCPYCSGRLPIIGFTDMATISPNLLVEWNYEKNKKDPNDFTAYSTQKVWWKCEKGHEWSCRIAHRSRGSGCPYCSGKLPILGETDLETTNPELAKEWDYEKNEKTPQDYTSGSASKVWWVCENKHEWQAVIYSRKNGNGCPYCSGSKTERLVYGYLKEIHIPFIAEKKFEQDIRVKWFPFDVWISSKRLIIEPDGEQHFSNKNGYFEQDIPFDKRREHDNIKNQFCLEQKIPILRIPYTYNPDTEKEKIKSMIKDFIETRKIPQEIIDFYEQYKENNNYAEIARKLNELN